MHATHQGKRTDGVRTPSPYVYTGCTVCYIVLFTPTKGSLNILARHGVSGNEMRANEEWKRLALIELPGMGIFFGFFFYLFL